MALTENTLNRLYNWKFDQAQVAVEKQRDDANEPNPTPHETEGIQALAMLLGNSGWFGGQLGNVVSLAVHDLIGDYGDET